MSIVKITLNHQVNKKFIQFYQSCSLYKISVFRIQREILCCSIDFVSLVCLCKSNKLSTQIERVNHFDPSFHQIERFNQTFLRKSTSVHHLIKLRVIHIQQLDSILSFVYLSCFIIIIIIISFVFIFVSVLLLKILKL